MTIEHDLELVRAGCSGTGEYAACYHHNEAADRLADEVERLRAENLQLRQNAITMDRRLFDAVRALDGQ